MARPVAEPWCILAGKFQYLAAAAYTPDQDRQVQELRHIHDLYTCRAILNRDVMDKIAGLLRLVNRGQLWFGHAKPPSPIPLWSLISQMVERVTRDPWYRQAHAQYTNEMYVGTDRRVMMAAWPTMVESLQYRTDALVARCTAMEETEPGEGGVGIR